MGGECCKVDSSDLSFFDTDITIASLNYACYPHSPFEYEVKEL